jgi:hypothetical protein
VSDRLQSGRRYDAARAPVVDLFEGQPDELTARVRPHGFDLALQSTANGHFLYGGSR